MHVTPLGAALAASSLVLAVSAIASPATAHDTGIHDNCTNLNKVYPHGVGTKYAKDKTSGKPVTTFKRAPKIYWEAEKHNPDLDRDNDRIACEKA
jgi:hypothetical protein